MAKRAAFLTLVFLLVGSTPLWAGRPDGPGGRRWRDLEMVRMWRLTQELDLTEEEAAKVFPLLNRYGDKRRKLQAERRRLLGQLGELLREKAPREELEAKMAEVERVTRELEEVRWKEWRELKKILPPRKQARYLLFHERFVKDLWRIMRGRHREGPSPRPLPD